MLVALFWLCFILQFILNIYAPYRTRFRKRSDQLSPLATLLKTLDWLTSPSLYTPSVTTHHQGFPEDASSEEPACQCRRHEFGSWVRKIPWRRKWQHIPAFLPGKFHGQRSLVGYSPWGLKESDVTDCTRTHTHTHPIILTHNWINHNTPIFLTWTLTKAGVSCPMFVSKFKYHKVGTLFLVYRQGKLHSEKFGIF